MPQTSIEELVKNFIADSPEEQLIFDQVVGTLNMIAKLEADIEDRGITFEDPKGREYSNPSVLALNRARWTLTQLVARLWPPAKSPGQLSMQRASNARWGRVQ